MSSGVFPGPFYSRTTGSGDIRALNTAASTESLASTFSATVASNDGYIRPEQASTAGEAVAAVGTAKGWGWTAVLSTLGYTSTSFGPNVVVVDAGTWSVVVHYSRDGGLGTGDIATPSWTAILFEVDTSNVVVAEIGRATAVGGSITTTEASVQVDIVIGSAYTFTSGSNKLYLEVHQATAPVLGDANCQCHTNSTTSTRISAGPTYSATHATDLSADGIAVASGVGAPIGSGVAAATGAGATSGVLGAFGQTLASATGVGAATAIPTSILATVFASSGVATINGVFGAFGSMLASSGGFADVSGVGAPIGAGVFASAGSGVALAAGSSVAGTVAAASGTAAVLGVGASTWSAEAASAGIGTALGDFGAFGAMIAAAAGNAIVLGDLGAIGGMVAAAAGVGDAAAASAALSASVASADGTSAASGIGGLIFAAVGTCDIGGGGGGGGTTVIPVFNSYE